MDEKIFLFESLLFHQFGDFYRNFKNEPSSSSTTPNTLLSLDKIEAFIRRAFQLSDSSKYLDFTAEARRGLISSGSSEDETKIEISDVFTLANEIPDQIIEIKSEVETPNGRVESPKDIIFSCGQCRTRKGDFQTLDELNKHMEEHANLPDITNQVARNFESTKTNVAEELEEALKEIDKLKRINKRKNQLLAQGSQKEVGLTENIAEKEALIQDLEARLNPVKSDASTDHFMSVQELDDMIRAMEDAERELVKQGKTIIELQESLFEAEGELREFDCVKSDLEKEISELELECQVLTFESSGFQEVINKYRARGNVPKRDSSTDPIHFHKEIPNQSNQIQPNCSLNLKRILPPPVDSTTKKRPKMSSKLDKYCPSEEKAIFQLLRDLEFEDLKNARLVCKLWNDAGVEHLSRIELRPIKLKHRSNIGLKQLLKSFKQTPNPRIFQSFELKLRQIDLIAEADNFLTQFQPKHFTISGDAPNSFDHLDLLFKQIAPTLSKFQLITELTVSEGDYYVQDSIIGLLSSINQLSLKSLDLDLGSGTLYLEESNKLSNALESILKSQCSTLEYLSIDFNFKYKFKHMDYNFINLPIFPHLKSLQYKIQEFIIPLPHRDSWNMINPFDFSSNFPILEDLTVTWGSLRCLKGSMILTRDHPLCSLSVEGNDRIDINFDDIAKSFPHLETLSFHQDGQWLNEKGNFGEFLANLGMRNIQNLIKEYKSWEKEKESIRELFPTSTKFW